MFQPKRFLVFSVAALLAVSFVPARAQSLSLTPASPAASPASSVADVHLSSPSRATAMPSGGLSSLVAAPGAFSPAASLARSALARGLSSTSRATTTTTTRGPSWARFASGTGNILFLGAGTLLPLIEDGKDGQNHALRTADSLLTSTLITEALKRIVREKRPDSNERTSFPSGHATAAFAVATMESAYHPKQAIFWYAGATAIAYSRVKLRRHYTQDVLAGAAIGFLTARLELKQPRGFILAPFIKPRGQGGGGGFSISKSF